eukprot:1150452-Pelagomonas_calceolata.AAC.3
MKTDRWRHEEDEDNKEGPHRGERTQKTRREGEQGEDKTQVEENSGQGNHKIGLQHGQENPVERTREGKGACRRGRGSPLIAGI